MSFSLGCQNTIASGPEAWSEGPASGPGVSASPAALGLRSRRALSSATMDSIVVGELENSSVRLTYSRRFHDELSAGPCFLDYAIGPGPVMRHDCCFLAGGSCPNLIFRDGCEIVPMRHMNVWSCSTIDRRQRSKVRGMRHRAYLRHRSDKVFGGGRVTIFTLDGYLS